VNPYDVNATAQSIHRALTMPAAEKARRMQSLRERVTRFDVHHWAGSFLSALGERPAAASARRTMSQPAELASLVASRAKGKQLILLLDYDGTLVELQPRPDMAAPDHHLVELLADLHAAGVKLHLVSGRSRVDLERWFGPLPITLHADHGFCWRSEGGLWRDAVTSDFKWKAQVRRIMQHHAERTPGSLIEDKSASVAWHWRMVEAEAGQALAKDLRVHLTEVLSNLPVQVLNGDRVVEVRLQGVNKGIAVRRVLDAADPGAVVVAFGDDRTDEDMFAALGDGAISVHIGEGYTRAGHILASVADARSALEALLRALVPAQ